MKSTFCQGDSAPCVSATYLVLNSPFPLYWLRISQTCLSPRSAAFSSPDRYSLPAPGVQDLTISCALSSSGTTIDLEEVYPLWDNYPFACCGPLGMNNRAASRGRGLPQWRTLCSPTAALLACSTSSLKVEKERLWESSQRSVLVLGADVGAGL